MKKYSITVQEYLDSPYAHTKEDQHVLRKHEFIIDENDYKLNPISLNRKEVKYFRQLIKTLSPLELELRRIK